MRKLILRGLLLVDGSVHGKQELKAWKRGIKLVQSLRFARFIWNSKL
jgi:hypothetical protein